MNNPDLQKVLRWQKGLSTLLSIESSQILYDQPCQTMYLAFYYDLSNDQEWHCNASNLACHLACLLLHWVSPNLFSRYRTNQIMEMIVQSCMLKK